MSEAAFCKEYVALLEAIRDALVGIDDEPVRMVRAMAEQAIEGDPKGAALDMRTYMNQRRALHGESALEGLPDEEQPVVGRMGCQLPAVRLPAG